MAEAVASLCVKKLGDYAIAAIFGQFEYLFRYNRNIQNLRDKVRDLKLKRDDMEDSVDAAKRNALVIKSEVDAWLKMVDDLKKEADEVLNSSTNSEMRCLCLGCPNLMTRCLLSKNATKKITAIDELLKVKFEEVGMRPPLNLLSSHGSERLKTRISTKEKIIKALEDTNISKVGICGLPGVGKTTMAKEVMTQVLKDKLFDEVAMAVVSKDVDIIRIQDKLADMLGLKIEQKANEVARASRLKERLTYDKKKRILVILDDVWTDIDLENLGFPSLSHREGLKILLTSRFEQVCKGMGALTNIKVETLDSDEAFAFLENISNISNHDAQLLTIAKQVAGECKGLPLALEVVGKTLINGELYAWKDALNELRKSQLENKVYSSIELSYNYLKSDEHRSLLLLCSLFPEDASIPIEILVRYAWGLKLFKHTERLLDTRDRAHTISDNLKSCHLLLPAGSKWEEEKVKLHDVIRDFCLSIASKGEDCYLVKHDLVTEWPEHNALESYSAISLTIQEPIRLPSRLRCGNLELLRMQFPGWIASKIDIPKFFLDDTQELIVIDISRFRILSPIQLSKGLRTLCLDGCVLEIGMSFFGSLKNLEILTLVESYLSVDFFRDEVGELSNLKLLDLRFQEGPRPLPPGFLLGMKKLEELYLGNYNGVTYEEKEHIIQEVSSLKALNNLQICTDDTLFLMQLLQGCSEKLETFQIRQVNLLTVHCRRYLSLENIDPNMLSEPAIKSVMRKSEDLSLKVKGWNNPVIELAEDGFINLKSLKLELLDSEYLIDAAGSIPSDIFRKLESLYLTKMSRLKEMCNANFPRMEHVTRGVSEPVLFRNLKEIEVRDCAKIKRMFSESVAKCMVNLEVLNIQSCPLLEEVVSVDTQENEITEPLSFPKLKIVELHDLESFVSFRSQPNAVGLRQTLLNQVTLPNMEKLTINGLDKMKRMFSESVAKCMVNLEVLNIQSCPLLEEVVSVDTQENEIIELPLFPKLREVFLCDLKSFVSFRSQPNAVGLRQTLLNPVTLPNMEKLTLCLLGSIEKILSMEETPSGSLSRLRCMEVGNCDKLVNIAQSNSIKLLKNLETLEVVGGRALNVIFDFEGLNVNKDNEEETSILGQLKSLALRDGYYLAHITRMVPNGIRVFQNLKELKVESCGRLRYLFPASMINSFVCLETLLVTSCDEIEEIFGREEEEEEGMASNIVFRELRSIELLALPRFKMFCSHNYELAFPSLDRLRIEDCHVMTKFCSGQLNAPKLKGVRLENGEIIDISNFPRL